MDRSSQLSDGIRKHASLAQSPRPARAAELRLRDRVLAHEAGAAEEFCSTQIGPLTAYVRSRARGTSQDVEDVVQETMARALARVGTYSGRSSLHTWLCAIAGNVGREFQRDRAAIARCAPLDSAEHVPDLGRGVANPNELDAVDEHDLAVANVAKLSSKYRGVLLAYYFERQSLAQIAHDAGQGRGAAKALLHRARTALRKLGARQDAQA